MRPSPRRFGETRGNDDEPQNWSVRNDILSEVASIESRYSEDISASPTFRYRHGESGLGQMFQVRTPLSASLPVGYNGRLRLLVEPDFVYGGRLSLDDANAGDRFGRIGTVLLAPGNDAIAQSEQGVALGLGYDYRGFYAHIGSTPLGFPLQSWVGGLGWQGSMGRLSLAADLSRQLLGDSLLAHCGLEEPLTGRDWGLVTANGGRVAISLSDGPMMGYGFVAMHWMRGTRVKDNRRVMGGAGLQWSIRRDRQMSVKTGLSATLMSFTDNVRFFTEGHGGYFSPQMFTSIGVPIILSGSQGRRLSYEVAGDVGLNWFHEDSAPYYPLDDDAQALRDGRRDALGEPLSANYSAQNSLGVGVNARAQVTYHFSSQLVGGLRAAAHFAGDYQELVGGLFVGYGFRPGGAPAAPALPHYWADR